MARYTLGLAVFTRRLDGRIVGLFGSSDESQRESRLNVLCICPTAVGLRKQDVLEELNGK